MTVTYGFYNSLNHDRVYDAKDFSEIFNGIIIDGVFQSVGTGFVVQQGTKPYVKIGIGRAWLNGTWTYNDSILNYDMPPADLMFPRIDCIALEINETTRVNQFVTLQGEAKSNPVNPTLTKTSYVHQYPLCYISRRAGDDTITQAQITNRVGTSDLPFVTGILKTVNLDTLLTQWDTQLDEFVAQNEADITSWFNTKKGEFNNWTTQQQQAFTTWISTKQGEFNTWYQNAQNTFTQFMDDNDETVQAWFNDKKSEFDAWVEQQQSAYTEWITQKQGEFNTWFENIKKIFDEGTITNLQTQIDDNFDYAMGSANSTITFNVDGSITDDKDKYTSVTSFESNGNIKLVITRKSDSATKTVTTAFNPDGSISTTATSFAVV